MLLLILKIIGIILLAILGILVLLVCIVLFVPIRYSGEAKASGKSDSISAKIKFSWLAHLISGYVVYEKKEFRWKIRIFWKTMSAKKDVIEEAEDAAEDLAFEENEEKSVETSGAETPEIKTRGDEASETISGDEAADKPKWWENVSRLFEKIKYTFQTICDKIELVEEFIQDEIHQLAFKRLKQEFLRLMHFLRPKKLTGNLKFGLDDPYQTGRILAVLSMLYPFWGEHINITPDFEHAVMEGDLQIKGRIRGIYAGIILWNLVWDKNVRTTVKEILNKSHKK